MVAVVFLHLVRTFLTGAFKNGTASGQNRPLNWSVGVVLFLLTLLLSFTGYLLPWDQLAYWAITVGTNIASAAPVAGEWLRLILLGGTTIDQSALIRFYVLHCFFLPVGLLLLFSYHMWRVRKDGGLACVDRLSLQQKKENQIPSKTKTYSLLGITSGSSVQVKAALVDEEEHTVSSSPNLSRRLAVVTIATLAIASFLTVLSPAPLEEPANPSVTPNPAKAPWYFLWLQELVTDTTFTIGGFTVNGALIGGIILPAILILALLVWPFIEKSSVNAAGVWFAKARRKQNIVFLIIVLAVAVFTVIGTFMRGPYWEFFWPWESWPEQPRKF
jgi:quinol-cytochrome oxidoreductase complex cytochrome b subunit